MSERLLIHKYSNSKTCTPVSNKSKLIDRNRKPLVSRPPLIQTKLTINQPGDEYEQEADRVAEQVMWMPYPVLQRECNMCDEGEKKILQTKESQGQVPKTQNQNVPPIVHHVLRSPGQPLDPATRAFMEPRFGYDFSKVRVHADSKAAESARAVNARAFTMGKDMVFGADQYSPITSAGRKLLAHELVHTVQQRSDENSRLVINDSLEHEHEVNTAVNRALQQASIPVQKSLNSRSLLRQELDPKESLIIKHNFGLQLHESMDAPAVRKVEKCEEFPGGSTDCEVDKKTGIPTGKITQSINETNPCTKPCVEQHEEVHLKQMKRFCTELRDCYLAADKGKRSVLDCVKMGSFGFGYKEKECPAYKVSVSCLENRLRNAKKCQSKENKEYGTRKLASEKCFRDQNCK